MKMRVFIFKKSTLDGSTHFKLSRHMIPQWSFHSFDDQGVGHFDIYNKADHRTLQMNSTQININMPVQPNKELNIDGDMSILGQTLYLMGQDAPDDPGVPCHLFKLMAMNLLFAQWWMPVALGFILKMIEK